MSFQFAWFSIRIFTFGEGLKYQVFKLEKLWQRTHYVNFTSFDCEQKI